MQSIQLSSTVSSGSACVAAAPNTLTPTVGLVGAGKTVTVMDYTADPFCCSAPGCPATYPCDETYTFTVQTSNGTLTQTQDVNLNLASCDVVCS